MERITKHRDRYNKVGGKHYSYSNMEMYARKVVLLQVLKYLPASPELAQAIALNDAAEVGRQGLTIDDAIAGTWTPVPAEDEEAAPARQALGPYPDKQLDDNLPAWRKLIAGGRSPDDIIKTIKSKYTLTPEQEAKIKAPAAPTESTTQVAPPVDAEWLADYDRKENKQ